MRDKLTAVVTGGTSPAADRPRWLRPAGIDLVVVVDALIAFIAFIATTSWLSERNGIHGNEHSGAMLVLISLVIAAPLLLRNRYPLAAWESSALAVLVSVLYIPPRSLASVVYLPGSIVVYVLCLYALAVRCSRRLTLLAAAVTLVGAALVDHRTAAAAVAALIPLLLGTVVRLRRTAHQELEEAERRHGEVTTVLEERQRIARELHDVVAHHMSVIATQAEAAPYKVADPPPELTESFADIRSSALEGLTELRRILGVLRTEGDAQTTPQPGLDRLDDILASARSGGLTVRATVSGEPVPLPPGVSLSAYRILQEALSNAMRHAPGATVQVKIVYKPKVLHIQVSNDSVGAPPGPSSNSRKGDSGPHGPRPHGRARGFGPSGGHGIIGMRERVTMLGGELYAGPKDGGFAVIASLPMTEDMWVSES
jgi:signal transduction histidine kinase